MVFHLPSTVLFPHFLPYVRRNSYKSIRHSSRQLISHSQNLQIFPLPLCRSIIHTPTHFTSPPISSTVQPQLECLRYQVVIRPIGESRMCLRRQLKVPARQVYRFAKLADPKTASKLQQERNVCYCIRLLIAHSSVYAHAHSQIEVPCDVPRSE